MVVKSATKKKLMDLGIDENFAHALADDRKWDDVKVMSQADIAKICETDSETAGNIHGTILAATQKGRDGDGENSLPSQGSAGRTSKRRTRAKTVVDMEPYDHDRKMQAMENELANDLYAKLGAVEATGIGAIHQPHSGRSTMACHSRARNSPNHRPRKSSMKPSSLSTEPALTRTKQPASSRPNPSENPVRK